MRRAREGERNGHRRNRDIRQDGRQANCRRGPRALQSEGAAASPEGLGKVRGAGEKSEWLITMPQETDAFRDLSRDLADRVR